MANLRRACLACAGLLTLLSGCVERRFVIESTPPGAKVYVNDRAVGFTPCDVPFTYYGIYRIQLELDGHQTLIKDQKVSAPWYEFPPIDFFAENVYPFKASDVIRLQYDLAPLPRPNLDELRQQAEELRQEGRNLPPPSVPAPQPNNRRPAPAPAVPPPPAPAPVGVRPPVPDPVP